MPSPINIRKFYRRKNGAWVKIGGHYRKVGGKNFPHLTHYSRHLVGSDRKRRARRNRRLARRYPHAYDY